MRFWFYCVYEIIMRYLCCGCSHRPVATRRDETWGHWFWRPETFERCSLRALLSAMPAHHALFPHNYGLWVHTHRFCRPTQSTFCFGLPLLQCWTQYFYSMFSIFYMLNFCKQQKLTRLSIFFTRLSNLNNFYILSF